jgi:hypothetical protein
MIQVGRRKNRLLVADVVFSRHLFRFSIIGSLEKCCLCDLPLLTRQFYVFPCQHSFHADCLVDRVSVNGLLNAFTDCHDWFDSGCSYRLLNISTLGKSVVCWTCKSNCRRNSTQSIISKRLLGSTRPQTSL